MKTPVIRVSLGFTSLPDNTLITFARNVKTLLYPLAAFASPPVTEAVLEAAIDSFATAKAAQPSGGKAATAEKDNRRADLLALLKKLALFAQEASANNLAVLLSSGFQAVSLNRAQYPLSKPALIRIVNGMTGEALVTTSTESIARGCEIRVAEINDDNTPGEFRPAVFSTSSRNVLITDLVPGKLYAYQSRNVGGSTTYSDWSDVLVQRAG